MIGRVKLFNHKKRYGFISGDDGRDYFVSSSDVRIPSGNLDEGYTVVFTPSFNDYGRKALDVDLY